MASRKAGSGTREMNRRNQHDKSSETLDQLHHVVSDVTSRKQYGSLEIDDLGVALVYFLAGECIHFVLPSKPDICALCGAHLSYKETP